MGGLAADAAIPERPRAGQFFHDLAGIVDAGDAETLREIQRETFQSCGVPIVVVTINRMNHYDPGSPSIESFARRWFDSWGIGSQASNNGMLVIVSQGDRKARIELGAQWERRFDGFCKQLMDRKMVPEFKAGDYGAGLIAAVSSLSEIAQAGPQVDPPEPGLTDRILHHPVLVFNRQNNPIANKGGPVVLALMVIAGVGCLVAAFFLPQYRKPLVIIGALLIATALLFWILIAALFLWGKFTGRTSGGGGGGGGGFGGGSSGGGGASGGW